MNYKFLCALALATCTYVGTKAENTTPVATHTYKAPSTLEEVQSTLGIRYVNMEYIYENLPEAKKRHAEMQSFQKQLENQIQSKVSEYQEKIENAKQQESTLTEAQKKQISLELNKLESVIRELDEQKFLKIRDKYKKDILPIRNRIRKAIKEISLQHNYIVFDYNDADIDADTDVLNANSIILFAQKNLDISEFVLEKLKEETSKEEGTPPVIGPQNQDNKKTDSKQKGSSKASASAKKKK